MLTRQICFYSIRPHIDGKVVRAPQDLYPIGKEVKEVEIKKETKRQKRLRNLYREELEKQGFKVLF